jgi:cytochrome c
MRRANWIGTAALVLAASLGACSPSAPKSEAPAPAAENSAPPPAASAPATPSAAAPAAGAKMVETQIKGPDGKLLSGDLVNGEKVFKQCQSCHSIAAGKNMVGPTLHQIIGRKAGTVPGFKYSKANQSSGIEWTEQKMFEYLENPRAVVPGTIMAFVGLKKPQDRVDVIAYVQENSK